MVIAMHSMEHSQLIQLHSLQTNQSVQKKWKNHSDRCRLWPRSVRFHSKSALSITQKCKSQKKTYTHSHSNTKFIPKRRIKRQQKSDCLEFNWISRKKKSNHFQQIIEFYGFVFVLRPLSSFAPFKSQPKKERF